MKVKIIKVSKSWRWMTYWYHNRTGSVFTVEESDTPSQFYTLKENEDLYLLKSDCIIVQENEDNAPKLINEIVLGIGMMIQEHYDSLCIYIDAIVFCEYERSKDEFIIKELDALLALWIEYYQLTKN